MDVRITQLLLADALATVRPAVGVRSSLPVLSHVLLSTGESGLTVSATDLQIYIEHVLPVAEITQPGAITVPARLLSDFVRGLPSEVMHLTVHGQTLHIECGAFEANIKGLAAEEFPLIPEPAGLGYITLDADVFASMVDSVAPAAAKDQTRPILTGVLVTIGEDTIRMDAADGYRLHHCVEPSDSDIVHPLSAIVPTGALRQIAKCARESVDLALDNVRLFARSDGTRIVAQVIEGEYPDMSTVIPTDQNTNIILATDEALQATRMAHVFARDAVDVMHVNITPPDSIVVTAESAEHGDNRSELSGKVEGKAIEFAVSVPYILDALNAMDTESTRIGIIDSISPITIRPEYGGKDRGICEMVAVVMPMSK